MKSKMIRYTIVVLSIFAIIFALVKIFNSKSKLNTYLALGDYLSQSGRLKDEQIVAFPDLLGKYLKNEKMVKNVNNSYTSSTVTSEFLLEMISKDARKENNKELSSLIEESKYITISVGMNDIIQYLRYDTNKKELIYDKDYIERKIEIMKQNYYEIIEQIKEINEDSKVYLISYYCPFCYDSNEDSKWVFEKLNDAIREVSNLMSVYYVDISEVSKEENMYDKYQIYLNQIGHEYVFSLLKSSYFN